MIQASTSPFDLLVGIDRKSREQASGFPLIEEVRLKWMGIGFRIRDSELLISMHEILEVVSPPKVAQVPGVKPWVLGITNMRGNLLPILDLHEFLFGNKQHIDHRTQRIIVVSSQGVIAGLLVDAVHGMKTFFEEEFSDVLPTLSSHLTSFVTGSFTRREESYGVFSIEHLIRSEMFMDVAV